MINYKDKHVVITGAAGGIGEVLCERLIQQGAKLSICSKNSEKLNSLVSKISSENIYHKSFDITNEKEVELFLEESYKLNGEFHALVNLAGLSIPAKIPETSVEDYDTMIDVNVKGTFLASKHFVKHASKPSIIINTGSMAAHTANPNAPIYCTAKAAVNMFSKGLLLQVGSEDIRVTTINPGGIDTPFWGNRQVDKTKLMTANDVADIFMFVLTSNPKIQIHDINFESKARF